MPITAPAPAPTADRPDREGETNRNSHVLPVRGHDGVDDWTSGWDRPGFASDSTMS